MSLTAINATASAFDYTATFTSQQPTAGNAASNQAVAQLSFSEDSVEIDSYEGPTYAIPSLGTSGLLAGDTVNGIPVQNYSGSKEITIGSVDQNDETTMDLSFSYTENGQKKSVDLQMSFQEEGQSLLSLGGESSDSVAEQVLKANVDQSPLDKMLHSSHLGTTYDNTV